VNNFLRDEECKKEEDVEFTLTKAQQDANVFVHRMKLSHAKRAIVDEDYFEPIFKTLRPLDEYFDGCKIGSVEIVFDKYLKGKGTYYLQR